MYVQVKRTKLLLHLWSDGGEEFQNTTCILSVFWLLDITKLQICVEIENSDGLCFKDL